VTESSIPKPEPIAAPAATNPAAATVSPAPTGPRGAVVWLFIVFFGALFLWNAGKRDFWEPGEPLLAEIARTMETTGNWTTPDFAGPFLDLPPLTYWLAAVSHKLTGLDPRFSYRVPIAIAAMLGLWMTFATGKRFFDGRVGFLAMIIEASTYLFFRRAAWLDDDIVFAIACQASVTAFLLATRKGAKPSWRIAGWLGLAIAALSKSVLLGSGLVLGSIVVLLFFEGGLGRVQLGFRRMRSLPGILLFIAIAAPWYVFEGIQHGPELLRSHFLAHYERLVSSPVDAQPPYFYLVALLWALLPWSLFLPLGFLHAKDRLEREGERFAFTWATFMFVALSCVSAKKTGYLLVIWPPVALMISTALFETKEWFTVWEDFLREGLFPIVPFLLRVPVIVVLAVGVAYFTGYLGKTPDDRLQELLANRSAVLVILGIGLVTGAVLFAVSYRIRRLAGAKDVTRAAFELGCAAVFLFFAATFFDEGANAFVSSRGAMEKFAAEIPKGARVAVYGQKRASLFYYLGDERGVVHLDYPDPLRTDDPALRRIEEMLKQPGPAFIVTSKEELDTLKSQFSSLVPFLSVKDTARAGLRGELLLAWNGKE
jgi:4-amino-4-deoxy-L-arabinose transferase-like glycosyltransferase